MSTVYEQFQDILKDIDASPDSTIEQETIINEFNKIVLEGYSLTLEEKAEALAFSFAEQFTKEDGGYYFGPRFTMKGDDGSIYESPSLKEVQPRIVEYWEKRAASVLHPFLVARYAGLSWDLAFPKEKPKHNLRKQFIQASLDIVRKKLFNFQTVGIRYLGRALEIASKFNDQEFFEPIKKLTLSLEEELNEQDKPGPWGFAYDLLMNNKRIMLSQEEEKVIIDRLEQKIDIYAKPGKDGKTDPWACEYAVSRLAEYYKKKHLPNEVKRVVLTIGKAYEPLFANSSAFQVAGWMQSLHKIYLYHHLNEDAELLLKQMREVSAQATQEMGGIEHKFDIPKEEADAFVKSFYTDGVENALEQIVARFIPDKEDAKKSLYELAKNAPLQFSIPIQLTDHKGRTVAKVGPLEKDEDGHLFLRISEQLTFHSFFLHLVLEKGKENRVITKQTVLNFLSHSGIIHQSRFPLLDKALSYYFSEDYIGFVHVVIPQIEEAIRNLVEIGGGKTLRYKDGAYQLRTFDDVLRDDIVNSICGENLQLYIRIVFTDQRGMNLRNDICHGLQEYELFTKQTADRVLHALLTLSMIRKPGSEKQESTSE